MEGDKSEACFLSTIYIEAHGHGVDIICVCVGVHLQRTWKGDKNLMAFLALRNWSDYSKINRIVLSHCLECWLAVPDLDIQVRIID